MWELGDEDACEPVLSGSIPAGDVQTCVRFHPNAPTEFVTNGASRVFFWSSESEATAELRYYSPPVSAKDFKQPIGAFTVSCFLVSSHKDVAGQGRCVTGTADGDPVVFDSGGVPPGGAERLERRGMRPGDRRGEDHPRASRGRDAPRDHGRRALWRRTSAAGQRRVRG